MFDGFGPANLDWAPDAVVVGNVCRKDHVEVLAAQERKIPLESFPSLLGEAVPRRDEHALAGRGRDARQDDHLVAAGARAARTPGAIPSFLIGGVPLNFRQSWRLGAGGEFVVEGDEYDTAFFDKGSKFLHYRPQHRDPHLGRVRPRRHLPRRGGGAAPRSASSWRSSPRTACWSPARPRPARWRWRAAPAARSSPTAAPARAPTGRSRSPPARSAGAPRWRWRGGASGSASSRPNLPGIYNHENLIGVMAVASSLGIELPAIARGVRRFLGRAAPAGGARRRARRDRGRRLRAPPDGDPRDPPGAQGALRARQADRRLRAALGHQPPQRLPERVRRRAVGRRRGGAGAALRAGEGAGGRAARRRAAGRRSAARGRPGARHRRPSRRRSRTSPSGPRRATPCW